MGTVREWTQCSVKSIIALREWTFYEGVETAGILKSFAIETVRIIYDLQFCYFDGTTRIGIISHGAMFSQGGAKRYTYRCLFLKGCIPDSQGLYPEPQGSIASGIQRSKYQSCRTWMTGRNFCYTYQLVRVCARFHRQMNLFVRISELITPTFWSVKNVR